jgi:predicted nucleic acid-binding protein
LIVADSSYLAAGILEDEGLLRNQRILIPDLAIYETLSVIWKHQVLLRRLANGMRHVAVLFDFVDTNVIIPVPPDCELAERTHDLATQYRAHPHDMVFVALALVTGLELKSFDETQLRIMDGERARVRS